MFLSGLSLQNFRNYTSHTLLFSKPVTVILAPNASGKTNLLEAIHLLSTGHPLRNVVVDDLVKDNEEFGRVKVKVDQPNESVEIEGLLNRGIIQGKRTAKKLWTLNGVKKSREKLSGLFPTVAFIPEDLNIITGSPSKRREFLDVLISQLDPEYIRASRTYEQSLRRRNKLLQQIRDNNAPRTVLTFYDQSVLKHGKYIQDKRQEIINTLNEIPFPISFHIQYDPSLMNEARLQQYAVPEVAVGHTLIGPHKDDFELQLESDTSTASAHSPLATHGSRGQQRMGIIWLKIGAYQLLQKQSGLSPLFLLDDIFSELDEHNRQHIFDVTKQTQTIITSAEESILEMPELKNADIIRL